MTAIVAINDAKGFTFGADSAVTETTSYRVGQDVTDDGKLFTNGDMIFGYCDSSRMGQLLQFSLEVPKKKRSQTGLRYMATTFIDAVRLCFKNGGFAGKGSGAIDNEKEGEEIGGFFVVGFEKQLYVVESNYQILMPRLPYTALGCGEAMALGALYALYDQCPMLSPAKAARIALRAAQRYSGAVREPFRIIQRPH